MRWQRLRLRVALFLALTFLVYWLGFPTPVPGLGRLAEEDQDFFDELFEDEIREERYFKMVDEEGRTIVVTGRRLRVGDRYLDAEDRLYEVQEVDGYLAVARFIEQVEHELRHSQAAVYPGITPVRDGVTRRIAVYHTHNAESYVPSDGTDSIYGRGGIHDVGAAFRDALEAKGIEVLYSENLHLPHDRGAYRRSRVTASQLLARNPDAIFDVHRDAAPWEAYAMELEGEPISRIQFVVGLSHPGAAANRNFAFDLKGYADRIHPGLVRGVFLIWGSYNQDLSPTNLLLEVGAHTNTKESAIRGITLFADVVAFYFYGPEYLENGDPAVDDPEADPLPPALYRDAGGISGTVSGTVIGLLLASLGAALGFYFLNNPGALEELYAWWERLPERLTLLGRQALFFARNFPALVRRLWEDAPGNLRRGWYELRREARILPGRLAEYFQRGGRKTTAVFRAWAGELPGNWRDARTRLIRESRLFPRWLARLVVEIRQSAGRVRGRFRQKASFAWERFCSGLGNAWRGLKAEAAHFAALAWEKLQSLIRRRLR